MKWDAGEYAVYCMAEKVSFFPCPSQRNAGSVLRLALRERSEGAGRGGRHGRGVAGLPGEWHGRRLFASLPFSCPAVLIGGEGGWNKSTELEFGGGVADDHIKQS